MASSQNANWLNTYPRQHAGGTVPELLGELQTIDYLVVKRSRAQEHHPQRKSARLKASHRVNCTQHQQQSSFRKRPRTQNDPASPEDPSDERRKRPRGPVEGSTSIPAQRGNVGEEEHNPIAYWVVNERWPRQYLQQSEDMENILARKRSISAKSRKQSDTTNSDTVTTTQSSTDQGEPKSREQKSAEYRMPQYETVLATKGFSMKPSLHSVTTASKDWCKTLLEKEQKCPEDTLFRDDLFDSTCEAVRNRNETRVTRDIALLIVPSAEIFTIRGATHLECLIDSVNEGWNNSIPITKTRPQPDYTVGFRREAFTQEQLDRMYPIIGDFNDQSYFMTTWYMYFPFLTCEIKCGAAALDVADRQNAHSTAIAVRAIVELFRAVKREKELDREILAFSISHDHQNVRIYGHYAEIGIEPAGTKYYRHTIRNFNFVELDGREKWTAYKFTKNVYDNWMPKHFERICSAIDQIPANISFSVSQSETSYPEQSSGLSQGFSAQSFAHSSAGADADAASAQDQDNFQSSTSQDPLDTPGTSLTGREFKKPRWNQSRGTKQS